MGLLQRGARRLGMLSLYVDSILCIAIAAAGAAIAAAPASGAATTLGSHSQPVDPPAYAAGQLTRSTPPDHDPGASTAELEWLRWVQVDASPTMANDSMRLRALMGGATDVLDWCLHY